LVKVSLFRLEGVEKISGEDLCIFFAGIRQDLEYLGHMSLREGFKMTPLGRRFVWSALINSKETDCDIQVVTAHRSISRYLVRGKGFQVPRWIGTEVDLKSSRQLAENSKSLKWDMRKVRRNGYGYEVVHDRELFDYFYERMYLPYIANIYEDRSFLMSYDVMMSEFENCELGLVTKDGEYLAGGIVLHKDGTARGWSLGVLDGNKELVKEGVITALYYFETLHLLEEGIECRGFGSSRAFLRDGVLKFKRKWGAHLTASKPDGFFMRPLRDSAASRAFLENNPFLFEKDGAIHGGVFVPTDFSGDFGTWLARMYKDCYCCGMKKLTVFNPDGVQMGDLTGFDIMKNVEFKPYSSVF